MSSRDMTLGGTEGNGTDTKLTKTLLSLPLFEGTSGEALVSLNIRASVRCFSAGQAILDRHDDSCDVYFLISGQLHCVLWTEAGKEILFSSIKPGNYFGELSALDGKPRSLAVYAQSSSEVVILSRHEFRRILDSIPIVSARVLDNLVRLVRRLTDRLYQSATHAVEGRVRAYLANLSLESGNVGKAEFFRIPSHAEIANTIGANREAVTRAISALNKSGILESGRQRVRILLPDELLRGVDDVVN
jgi:CRP/FNR family cyclic AMP-dependent transcriptional regulator